MQLNLEENLKWYYLYGSGGAGEQKQELDGIVAFSRPDGAGIWDMFLDGGKNYLTIQLFSVSLQLYNGIIHCTNSSSP